MIKHIFSAHRYRLKLSRHFSLQANGPIQSFFVNKLLFEFIKHSPARDRAPFQLAWGMLSKESARELHNKIQRLIDEYLQIAEHDRRIPVEDKLTSSLFIMFHEDMEPELFKKQWKTPD